VLNRSLVLLAGADVSAIDAGASVVVMSVEVSVILFKLLTILN